MQNCDIKNGMRSVFFNGNQHIGQTFRALTVLPVTVTDCINTCKTIESNVKYIFTINPMKRIYE